MYVIYSYAYMWHESKRQTKRRKGARLGKGGVERVCGGEDSQRIQQTRSCP